MPPDQQKRVDAALNRASEETGAFRSPVFPAAPRRAADPPPPPQDLPPPRYPENPSPWARLGRWLFDRISRLR